MSDGAIRPGSLRHRVRIEKLTQSARNDHGEFGSTWETVATVWADVRPARGNEFTEADRVEGRTPQVIVAHYRTDITTDMRAVLIADRSRVMQILAIEDLGGQHRGMKIYATETETEVAS